MITFVKSITIVMTMLIKDLGLLVVTKIWMNKIVKKNVLIRIVFMNVLKLVMGV